MANKSNTNGNCYLCGAELSQTEMKKHLLKEAQAEGGNIEECYLLKIEGADNKDYWLFADMPQDKSLSALDKFLRNIWLECCGHLSEFYHGAFDPNYKVGKSRRIGDFNVGEKLFHEYDFGTPTDTRITIAGVTKRPKQKQTVRLLARNVPPIFTCAECGRPAKYICAECRWDAANPHYCAECAESHKHGSLLPITNSPRNGECGYTGEFDTFTFHKK